MFLRQILFPVIFLLALTPTFTHADAPADYPFVTFDEGLKRGAAESKPIFVYFGRYGCAWCDWTNKQSFSKEDLKKLYIDNFVLVYVDAESGKRLTLPNGERITEAELGARYRAFATPLFVYLDKDGKEIFKAPGFKSADEFKQFSRYVVGGHYKSQKLLDYLASEK